jgi:hypothetical protein
VEGTGSLTGHILSQGNQDMTTPRSRTTKVVVVMALVLVFLIGFGVLVATVANDFINELFSGFQPSQ